MDAGNDGFAEPTDQRGAQRDIPGQGAVNAGSHSDIGAFEDTSSYLVTSAADNPLDGTLRAAVLWANVSVNPLLQVPTANVVQFDTTNTFEAAATIDLSIVGRHDRGSCRALAITGNVEIDGPATPVLTGGGGDDLGGLPRAPPMRLFYVARRVPA